MRIDQIEFWTLQTLAAVRDSRPVEDSRVEIKLKLPEANEAARRIAGLVNAARGPHVLWIIGADEKASTVPRCGAEEFSNWWPKVVSQFNGLAPVAIDVVVPTENTRVRGICFETSRRPFVVLNPMYGKPGGGPVNWEVPWRFGTSLRSATREDLIRILVPQATLPSLEVLDATASFGVIVSGNEEIGGIFQLVVHRYWSLSIDLYVTPRSNDRVILPNHRARLLVSVDGSQPLLVQRLSFSGPSFGKNVVVSEDNVLIQTTTSEAIVSGPGRMSVRASDLALRGTAELPRLISITFGLSPAGSDEHDELSVELVPGDKEGQFKWTRPGN